MSLTRKNEALERTLHDVSLFARAVSHDVRTPVAAAAECVRLSLESETETNERYLALASENLLRADRMMVGLRDLMRVVGARPDPSVIEVKELVEDVVAELGASRGGAALPVAVRGPMGFVVGGRDHLTHVFRNLIGNALDHNRGHLRILIDVGQDVEGRGSPFYVRDNGRGVAPEDHGKVFEPFSKGSEANDEGLGLGLALVEALVTQIGGRVWVDSVPGGGATFYFTYPSQQLAEVRRTIGEPAAAEERDDPHGSSKAGRPA